MTGYMPDAGIFQLPTYSITDD